MITNVVDSDWAVSLNYSCVCHCSIWDCSNASLPDFSINEGGWHVRLCMVISIIDTPTEGLEMEAAHVIFVVLLYSVLLVSHLMRSSFHLY